MRRRYAIILPGLFVAVSLFLFAIGYYCVRSTAFWNQTMAASHHEAEPPLVPFLLPAVLLATIRGPAVILSTFDISEGRNLVLLPTGILWWWWVGRQLEVLGRRSYRRPRLRGIVFAVVAIVSGCLSIALAAEVSQRYWCYPHFGLSTWCAAMWTANVVWLGVLTVLAGCMSAISFRSSRANGA